MKRLLFVLCWLLWTASFAAADTIFLRDGRTVKGTVLGFVGGRFAVRVGQTPAGGTTTSTATSRPAGGEGEVQFFRPADIERVEIDGRSLDEARFQNKTVEVALAANWIDAGVDVRRGERVQVNATGTIVAGRSRITPGGLRSTDPTAPLPRAAEGVLIGAISNDPEAPIIEIGTLREFTADRDGRLYLTANRGNYTDARGAYSVQVRTERNLNFRRRGDAAAGSRDNNSEDTADVFDEDDRRTSPAPVRARNPRGGRTTDDPFRLPDERNRDRDPNVDDERERQRTPREIDITVPANLQNGTDTGVDLRAGERITINATGTIVAGQKVGSVSPEGGRAGLGFGYPFPSKGPGALLGFIRPASGQGQPQLFFVGSQLSLDAPADGRLFLLVNDDRYGDNSGSFTVKITY